MACRSPNDDLALSRTSREGRVVPRWSPRGCLGRSLVNSGVAGEDYADLLQADRSERETDDHGHED